jgi:hypothetical protein
MTTIKMCQCHVQLTITTFKWWNQLGNVPRTTTIQLSNKLWTIFTQRLDLDLENSIKTIKNLSRKYSVTMISLMQAILLLTIGQISYINSKFQLTENLFILILRLLIKTTQALSTMKNLKLTACLDKIYINMF